MATRFEIYQSSFFYVLCRVGLLYLYSADSIRKGTANGLEIALGVSQRCLKLNFVILSLLIPFLIPIGASALLFLSSAPRAMKGPIPAMLTATSAITGAYYGSTIYNIRQ